MAKRWLRLAAIVFFAAPLHTHAEDAVRVFAAASLTNALTDVAAQWTAAGHPAPTLVFAASSALARQIDSGAPADVFASADTQWMDYLAQRGRIDVVSRVELLGNALVLIAPRGRAPHVTMAPTFDLASAFTGKLCTGDPAAVPVGIYAKQSLMYLGWWQPLAGRIVGTDDARSALTFVERDACALGIVYATDAAIGDAVEVVARFPDATHAAIVYPFARVTGARPEATPFFDHLVASPEAAAAYARYGFTLLRR